MNELSANLLVPRAPQVNLIPPEVASRKAAGRQRGAVVAAFVVLALLLGGVTFVVEGKKRGAEASLQEEVDRGVALQAEVAKYAEVPLVKAQTVNAQSAAQYAGATEIRWVDFFSLVADGIPSAIRLDSWTLGVDSAAASAAPSGDPFASADIGVLNFSGTSQTYPDVAALERSLNAVEGFHNSSIPSVTRTVGETGASYTFSGTTRVTALAFDQRFTEGASEKLTRTRAALDLMDRESDAAIAVAVAQGELAAGVDGASEALGAALATYDAAYKESEKFLDLLEAYTSTRAVLAEAQAAVDAGTDGADAELVVAQATADTVAGAMKSLSEAIMLRVKAQKGVDAIEVRIVAAEALVAAKEEALATAQAAAAAAAAGAPISSQGVAYASQLVSEAVEVLTKEQEPLSAAEAAVEDAQPVVDAAIAQVPAALTAAKASGGGATT